MPAGEGQRAGLWRTRSLGGEQAVKGLLRGEIMLTLQLVEQYLLFGPGQHRQLAQTLMRVVQQADQQLLPMLGHARDPRFIEQVAAVGQAATETAI
ncbi:hypothetical protein D3C78_346550 [compost metagenome]